MLSDCLYDHDKYVLVTTFYIYVKCISVFYFWLMLHKLVSDKFGLVAIHLLFDLFIYFLIYSQGTVFHSQ